MGLIGGGELIDRRALKSDQTPDYSQAKPYRNYQQAIGANPRLLAGKPPIIHAVICANRYQFADAHELLASCALFQSASGDLTVAKLPCH